MSSPQIGDVAIISNPLGGSEFTIEVVNGTTRMIQSFENAIILSFFGGNELDDGSADSDEGYWGNLLENEDQFKLVSRFQFLVNSLPATSANLLLLEEAARADLAWLLTTKIASSVEAAVTLIGINRIRLAGTVTAQGLEQSFSFVGNWKAGVD